MKSMIWLNFRDSHCYLNQAGLVKIISLVFFSFSFSPLVFVLSLDATKIVSPPQNTQVDSGKLAKLMCETEYDASLQDTFELVWRKDNKEIPLSSDKHSR